MRMCRTNKKLNGAELEELEFNVGQMKHQE
jgi:hypothetical protein